MLILLSELAQRPVAFRETFWAVTGTAAPVIAHAAVLPSVDLARLHAYATTPDGRAWLLRYKGVDKLKPSPCALMAALGAGCP
jgi:hypothetical protein